MFIDKKRLKLYDTSIEICINHKAKEKLRKIAYKQKITMSEYIRKLIDFAISFNDIYNLEDKIDISLKDVKEFFNLLGGNFND